MFLSLPPVTRRRLKRRSVSILRSADLLSILPVIGQAEVSVFTTGTDFPFVQIDQHNMAGIEEMMRQLQESMKAMQLDAARQTEFAAR